MHVITPAEANVIATPAAEMTGLASPSRGSSELSTWLVRMGPGVTGVEHTIDREQVWMLTSGTLEVTAAGRTETVDAGQAVVLPAGVVRNVRTTDEAAEALVAMAIGGRAAVAGSDADQPVPWAQ